MREEDHLPRHWSLRTSSPHSWNKKEAPPGLKEESLIFFVTPAAVLKRFKRRASEAIEPPKSLQQRGKLVTILRRKGTTVASTILTY